MCEEIKNDIQEDTAHTESDSFAAPTPTMDANLYGADLLGGNISIPSIHNSSVIDTPNAVLCDNQALNTNERLHTEEQGALSSTGDAADSQYASVDELEEKIWSASELDCQTREKLLGEVTEIETTGGREKVSFGSCNGCSGTCHGSCSGSCSGSCDASKIGRSCYYK